MLMHKRIFEKLLLAAGLVLFGLFAVKVLAQNVTQSYQSDTALQNGVIVRLTEKAGNKIEPLTAAKQTDMLGVVVAPGDAPVALSNNGDQSQTFVATFGQYDVVVSNQNGPVKVGDYLTISSADGVGMKADKKQLIILGKALKAFDGQSAAESTTMLVDSSGAKKTVSLGRIPVDISVAHNPLYQPENPNGVPNWLARAVQIVTNKPVGAVRVYASLAAMIVAVVIAGTLLYSGVRSSMAAVGRNPLAKKLIMRNLLQVVLLALIIVSIGLFAVYLLLKL
jgi:hypothetical protein